MGENNQEWWTTEVASAIRGKGKPEVLLNISRSTGISLIFPQYEQRKMSLCCKKKAAKTAVGKARNYMESHLYTKLDEDGGKKMIYKIAS